MTRDEFDWMNTLLRELDAALVKRKPRRRKKTKKAAK